MTLPTSPSDQSPTLHEGWSFTSFGPEEGTVPIIAIHGLPGSVRDFRWLEGALSAIEFEGRFIRLEMPGFGQTTRAAGPSPQEIAHALVDFIDEVAGGRAVLMAHSFGSVYAAEVAARYPTRVTELVFISPVSLSPHRGYRKLPPMPLVRAALASKTTQRLFLPRFTKAMESMGFKNMTDKDSLRVLECLTNWSWERQAENMRLIAQPRTIIHAKDDRLIEPEKVEELAELLGVEVQWFETGGHNPQKTQAMEIAAQVPSPRPT